MDKAPQLGAKGHLGSNQEVYESSPNPKGWITLTLHKDNCLAYIK